MKSLLTAALLFLAGGAHAAGAGCQDTTGGLVLEKIKSGAVGTQPFGCINRSFDAISGFIPSTPTVAALGVSTAALQAELDASQLIIAQSTTNAIAADRINLSTVTTALALKLNLTGGTVTGQVTMSGAGAYIVSGTSIVANYFQGSGAGLTNLPSAETGWFGTVKTFGSTVTVQGTEFSVGLTTLTVRAGRVGINKVPTLAILDVAGNINTSTSYMIGGSSVLAIPEPQSISLGIAAGQSGNTGSIHIGYQSGFGSSGGSNTFIGRKSGFSNTTASANTYVGSLAGNDSTGANNTYIGTNAGYFNAPGTKNTYVGALAGQGLSSGSGDYNTMLGAEAGFQNASGSRNTYLGYFAGNTNSVGSGNVFIGYYAGASELSSNLLRISNNSSNALITGDFSYSTVTIPNLHATFGVVGGTSAFGGATDSARVAFKGTTYTGTLMYLGDGTEDNYIRGGKATSDTYIGDVNRTTYLGRGNKVYVDIGAMLNAESGFLVSTVTISTIGNKIRFDNARRAIFVDPAGSNPVTISNHAGAGSIAQFALDFDDSNTDAGMFPVVTINNAGLTSAYGLTAATGSFTTDLYVGDGSGYLTGGEVGLKAGNGKAVAAWDTNNDGRVVMGRSATANRFYDNYATAGYLPFVWEAGGAEGMRLSTAKHLTVQSGVTASSVTSQSGFSMLAGQALIGATAAQAGSDIRIIAARNTSGNHTYIRSDAAAANQAAFEWSKDGTSKWAAIVEGGSNNLGFYDGSAYAFILNPVSAGGSSFASGVTASSFTSRGDFLMKTAAGDQRLRIQDAGSIYFDGNSTVGGSFIFRPDGGNIAAVITATEKMGVGSGLADPQTTLDVSGDAQFGNGATKSTFTASGDLTVGGKIGAGGVVGGAGFPLRVEGGAQFNEAGDATNFLQLQASGDSIYYDSFGTAANSGGHVFRVSDASKVALTLDATGGAGLYPRTKAQLLTIAAPVGALYYCSDCADATSGKPTVVIATGTSAGNFGTLPIGVFQ